MLKPTGSGRAQARHRGAQARGDAVLVDLDGDVGVRRARDAAAGDEEVGRADDAGAADPARDLAVGDADDVVVGGVFFDRCPRRQTAPGWPCAASARLVRFITP